MWSSSSGPFVNTDICNGWKIQQSNGTEKNNILTTTLSKSNTALAKLLFGQPYD